MYTTCSPLFSDQLIVQLHYHLFVYKHNVKRKPIQLHNQHTHTSFSISRKCTQLHNNNYLHEKK